MARRWRWWENRVVAKAVWLEKNGYPLDDIPEHLPSCNRVAEGDPPVIRSPQPGADYRLRTGVPAEFQKILLDASVSNQTSEIYWFADGDLLYSGPPTERVFFTPTVGTHTLLCMDDEGRSSEVNITIR